MRIARADVAHLNSCVHISVDLAAALGALLACLLLDFAVPAVSAIAVRVGVAAVSNRRVETCPVGSLDLVIAGGCTIEL